MSCDAIGDVIFQNWEQLLIKFQMKQSTYSLALTYTRFQKNKVLLNHAKYFMPVDKKGIFVADLFKGVYILSLR